MLSKNQRSLKRWVIVAASLMAMLAIVCKVTGWRPWYLWRESGPPVYIFNSLQSPASFERKPPSNQKAAELVRNYNARQDKIAEISLVGNCYWDPFPEPSRLHLQFNRSTGMGAIRCSD